MKRNLKKDKEIIFLTETSFKFTNIEIRDNFMNDSIISGYSSNNVHFKSLKFKHDFKIEALSLQ